MPLHPSIGEAFYNFVQANTKDAADFVFSCFRFVPDKKTRGAWASDTFHVVRDACGLRKAQYGMRGTYLTYLVKAGVDPDLARYVTAHGDKDVHAGFYLNFGQLCEGRAHPAMRQ